MDEHHLNNAIEIDQTKASYAIINNQLVQSEIDKSYSGNPLFVDGTFDRYGPNKTLRQFTQKGAPVVLLWSYKNTYPIAEIKNTTYDAIEAALGGKAIVDNFGMEVPAKSRIDNFLSTVQSALPNAQITNYAYDPLAGMTSMTDAKGMTTYYEYDNFMRLMNIKDADGNIVKNYCYNYAGQQTTDCVIQKAFSNTAQSGSFIANCNAGYQGSPVIYTVPAGRYTSTLSQADADQQALNDISANGQGYANGNGCVLTYYSVAESGTFTANPLSGYQSIEVVYSVQSGAYTSIISQADADSKAINDVNTNGQSYADAHGHLLIYYSAAQSGNFAANCGSGYQSTTVPYSIAASAYTSTISQADADQQALNALNSQGQANSNNTGCKLIYYNTAKSGSFTANCGAGYQSTIVPYNIGAGTYSSIVSQADADQQAVNALNNQGQTNANNTGCKLIYYNATQSGNFTASCGAGYQSTTVPYSIGAGAYSSIVSQADADQQATTALNSQGQSHANASGCLLIYYSAAQAGNFTASCSPGYQPTIVPYNVAAGQFTSTTSQADADQQALNYFNNQGQANANANGCLLIYYSAAQSGNFTASCPGGYQPTTVTYTQSAGQVTSTVSQADADQRGANLFNTNGQGYANNIGCKLIYYSAAQSGNFTASCAAGYQPTSVPYNVAAGQFTSIVSQGDANQQAANYLNSQGQANANNTGCTLIYYSGAKSGTFTMNNCPGGAGTGGSVIYTVNGGAYNSTVSQADADNQAQNDVNANGQNYANTHGRCVAFISGSHSADNGGLQGYSVVNSSVGDTFSWSLTGSGKITSGQGTTSINVQLPTIGGTQPYSYTVKLTITSNTGQVTNLTFSVSVKVCKNCGV